MTTATIYLSALEHNLSRVRALAPKQRVLAMIKADAYGHGLLEAAEALRDADAYGVARLGEALELRQADIIKRIVIMAGVHSLADLHIACQHKLEIMVHQNQHLDWLEQLPSLNPVRVWLKVDTGMHRLGFKQQQAQQAYERLMANPAIAKPIIATTHFACADQPTNEATKLQLQSYQQLTKIWRVEHSLANSAGVCKFPQAHGDWVRPGLMLYGISPFPGMVGKELGLRPAMTVRAPVIALRELLPGDAIGYGATYCCDRPTKVALVAVGYGDGYPRHAISGTKVLLNGRECKLLGRVSMDTISVDIGEHQAALGDEVVLWGDELPVEHLADSATTIAHELVTGVTSRVQRIYAN